MSQKVIYQGTGTGATPADYQFPSENDLYAHVFVVFSKEQISSEYDAAIQNTIQGYLNDSARNIDCTSLHAVLNLPKSEVGTSIVRMEIHSGALLTDEQAAALDAQTANVGA